MSNEISAIEGITKAVEWYAKLPSQYTNIDKLMTAQRKLCGYMFAFASQVGEAYEQKNACEFERKSKYDKARHNLLLQGETASKADIDARALCIAEAGAEQTTDAIYRKMYLLLEAAKEVRAAMQQQISNLKEEKRLEYTGQGSQQK